MTQAPEQKQRRTRSGSFMSDKQIAQAALRKQLVIFRFLSSQVPHEVQGYIVGMDDYKWLVASPTFDERRTVTVISEPITTSLIHKSVDLVLFGSRSLDLKFQPEPVQIEVTAIGQSFWDWCQTHHTGREPSGA